MHTDCEEFFLRVLLQPHAIFKLLNDGQYVLMNIENQDFDVLETFKDIKGKERIRKKCVCHHFNEEDTPMRKCKNEKDHICLQ